MPGLDLAISSRPIALGGIEAGRGKLRSITIETTVHGRGITQRTGRHTLDAPTFGEKGLRWSSVDEAGALTDGGTMRGLAAAQ
ncbi:hypothetical protein [Rhodococcus sp. H29-C3]|uniref:hypothetical protein n=1 Tax=Rhodococcus sp. H29-C3 TaxID=3046307 RepID=UPI0024BA6344|nr:hypothetical protein [Rhodococcus sp. H29-C3]MDJ0363236.1 hypothetical protein [Rhodococcus sp. H29-C3]